MHIFLQSRRTFRIILQYHNLFNGALPSVNSDLISRTIPCLVNDADNAALTQLPTFREVE